MKHLIHLLLAIACFLTASSAFAQVDVFVKPARTEFLVGEGVPISVTFVNHTDRTITMRDTKDLHWLNFNITIAGRPYPVNATANTKFSPVTLRPGQTIAYTVDVRPYYDLSREGRYSISATVVLDDGRTTRSSNRTGFTLSQGGVVKAFDIQARGKKLRVAVKLLTVQGSGPCLFGQVMDASSNSVLGACFLGKYLNFMKPCIRLDSAQNLHVLCQSTPEYFTYSIMNTYGGRSSQNFYRRSGGPVDLILTGGGVRPIGLMLYTKKTKEEDRFRDASDRPQSH